MNLKLEKDSIAILQPVMDTVFCQEDSLLINWELFGDIKIINVRLSNDAGQTFPISVASNISLPQDSIKFPLSTLSGNEFVLELSDTTTNGFSIQSNNI